MSASTTANLPTAPLDNPALDLTKREQRFKQWHPDLIETAETVTREYVETGGRSYDELLDKLDAALPIETDPDGEAFSIAEKMFSRLTGIATDISEELGPRRVDYSKPKYIIPRKDNSGNYGPWFPRGAVSLAAGSSGHGKTTVMLRLLEHLRKGEAYFDHPAAHAEYGIILADRPKSDLEESASDCELDKDAILSRSVEADLLDATPAHVVLARQLKKWEDGRCIPDVVFIEGADLWCNGAEEKQPTLRFLKPLIDVAREWNIAVIASVGSPKQKKADGYTLTRDKIFGSVAWGRTCSTILHVTITNPDDADSARQLSVMPRKGRQEVWYFTYEAGVPVFSTTKPEKAAPAELAGVAETRKLDRDAELISYLETLPAGQVIELKTLIPYYGARNTVRERLTRLAHPVTGWVTFDESEGERGRWRVRKPTDHQMGSPSDGQLPLKS